MRELQSTKDITEYGEKGQRSFRSKAASIFRNEVTCAPGSGSVARNDAAMPASVVQRMHLGTSVSSALTEVCGYGAARLLSFSGLLYREACFEAWAVRLFMLWVFAGAFGFSEESPLVGVCFSLRSFPHKLQHAGPDELGLVCRYHENLTNTEEQEEKQCFLIAHAGNDCMWTAK